MYLSTQAVFLELYRAANLSVAVIYHSCILELIGKALMVFFLSCLPLLYGGDNLFPLIV